MQKTQSASPEAGRSRFELETMQRAASTVPHDREAVYPGEEQMAAERAAIDLAKVFNLEFKHIRHDIRERTSAKDFTRRIAARKEFLPRYSQMHQFLTRMMDRYPFRQASAWQEYAQVLTDNATDLMQAVQDLYTLGQEDWRFVVLQAIVGVFYNKREGSLIQSVIIDNHDKAVANLMCAVLRETKVDIHRHFGTPVQPQLSLPVDEVLIGLRVGVREALRNEAFFFEVITPIALSTAYQRLTEAVRVVECSYIGSEYAQRTVYTQDLKHSSPEEIESITFFA